MQTWRRPFATSVARLGHNATASARPKALRCAQILRATKHDRSSEYENQELRLQGYIRSVRKQKRFAFAEISDGSTVVPLQAILTPSQAAEYVGLDQVPLRLSGPFETLSYLFSVIQVIYGNGN